MLTYPSSPTHHPQEYIQQPAHKGPSLPFRAPSTSSISATRSSSDGSYPRPLPSREPPKKDMAADIRQALLEKSKGLALTAREKSTGSFRDSGGAAVVAAAGVGRRVSSNPEGAPLRKSSSVGSQESFASVGSAAAGVGRNSKWGGVEETGRERTPSVPNVPKRPPLLVSNQVNEPPPTPTRDSVGSETGWGPPALNRGSGSFGGSNSGSSSPPPAKPSAVKPAGKVPPPRPTKPVELKSVTPPGSNTPPAVHADVVVPPRPRPLEKSTTATSVGDVPDRPLKPSEIRAKLNGTPKSVVENGAGGWTKGMASPPLRDGDVRGRSPSEVKVEKVVLPPTPPGGDAAGRGKVNPFLVDDGDAGGRPKSHDGNPKSVISEDALRTYNEIFEVADDDRDGFVSATDVRKIWMRSGLDKMILARIWTLTDVEERSSLNKNEFAVGMFLIDDRLRGYPVPETLPHELEVEIKGRGRHAFRR
ncbi:actin organization and endocytosis protein [Phlyctochytrium planicorne]|nr:actin organization and endocytosis protein [Phlyctochytrium planicorne]